MESYPSHNDTHYYETMDHCRIKADLNEHKPASFPNGDTSFYESVSQCRIETDLDKDKTASITGENTYYYNTVSDMIQADSEKPASIHSRDVYDQVRHKTSKHPSVSSTNDFACHSYQHNILEMF